MGGGGAGVWTDWEPPTAKDRDPDQGRGVPGLCGGGARWRGAGVRADLYNAPRADPGSLGALSTGLPLPQIAPVAQPTRRRQSPATATPTFGHGDLRAPAPPSGPRTHLSRLPPSPGNLGCR